MKMINLSAVRARGILLITIFLILLCWSCEKKGDIINLHINETGCANPWPVNNNDPDYLYKVKGYLEEQNIYIKKISITNDGPLSGCFSCFCTTGRRINITIYEADKTHALEIGFYEK